MSKKEEILDKDFKNKIRICQKEANETKHWLRMISTAVPNEKKMS